MVILPSPGWAENKPMTSTAPAAAERVTLRNSRRRLLLPRRRGVDPRGVVREVERGQPGGGNGGRPVDNSTSSTAARHLPLACGSCAARPTLSYLTFRFRAQVLQPPTLSSIGLTPLRAYQLISPTPPGKHPWGRAHLEPQCGAKTTGAGKAAGKPVNIGALNPLSYDFSPIPQSDDASHFRCRSMPLWPTRAACCCGSL